MYPAIGCCPFCENYKKLYFNAKHLEKGLNRGAKMFGAFFFQKKVSFLANIGQWPNFSRVGPELL